MEKALKYVEMEQFIPDNFKRAKFMAKVNLNLLMDVYIRVMCIKERCMVMASLFLMITPDMLVNLEIIVSKEEEFMKPVFLYMVG